MVAKTTGPGPWCGTAGGYTNHLCDCGPCTDAHAKAHKARRHRRYAEREIADAGHLFHPALKKHGTCNGYTYWGCRCPACTKAKRQDDKMRRIRAR